jgi:serralysin
VIDYQGTATSAVYASTGTNIGTLTLYNGSTVVGTLTLAGDYSGSTFTTTPIGSGVTQIVDPPAAENTSSTSANPVFQLTGNQTVVGSGVNDTFVANPGFGQDTITNFNTATDVIQFNHALFANYAAMIGAGAISQSGTNTVITSDKNDTVTLTNVAPSSLGSNNFHFV